MEGPNPWFWTRTPPQLTVGQTDAPLGGGGGLGGGVAGQEGGGVSKEGQLGGAMLPAKIHGAKIDGIHTRRCLDMGITWP